LLRSMPSIEARVRSRLPVIEGSIPHPYNRPSGCPFYPRCSEFMPGRCDQVEPPSLPVGKGHDTACLLYGDDHR
jgi:peptide/nickel transport system ATP-binding protein